MAKEEYQVWCITTKTFGTFKFWGPALFCAKAVNNFICGRVFDEEKQQFETNISWLNLNDIVIATKI